MGKSTKGLKSELNRLILKVEYQMTKQLADFLKANTKNMTPASWLVLESLDDSTGRTMTELCVKTHINDSTLTKIVDRMVKDSLAYRKADSKDRRKVVIFRSKRGSTLFEKLKGPIEESFEGVFPEDTDKYAKELVNNLQGLLANSEAVN